jgi:hypothetical protein
MNHYLKGRQLIHGEILSPETVIATFSEEFSTDSLKKIVATLNYGDEMLQAYKTLEGTGSWDIGKVLEALQKMASIHRKWSYENYAASRGEK